MNRISIFLFTLGLSSFGVFTSCRDRSADQQTPLTKPIRVTAIPDENPTELHRKFAPMVAFLEKTLSREVHYVPVTDYGAAVQALIAGHVDFAWLGGFTHVQARNLTKVTPLCMRAIDRKFQSVFIAHRNSGIETMADIKGKKVAFGAKSSTSGHLMPRHFLSTNFNINTAKDFAGEPVFSGAHDATAKIVESGRVHVGVLNAQVWNRLVATKRINTDKVRVIWTTPPYVDYVWTARDSVSENLRHKFSSAFIALDHDKPNDRQILNLQGAKKFVGARARDFDAIERVARTLGMLQSP